MFADDVEQGRGELLFRSGTILQATWRFSRPQSPGIFLYPNSDNRYVGDFSEDLLHSGFGICLYNNGDRYYGLWNNDKRQGKGFFLTRGGTELVANWYHNNPEGSAVIRSSNDECFFVLSKVTGDWYNAEGLAIHGHLRLSLDSSQQQHHHLSQGSRVISRSSTLLGDKWESLFDASWGKLPRYDNDECEALHLSFMRTILEDPSYLLDDLKNMFRSRIHPFGAVIHKFLFLLCNSFVLQGNEGALRLVLATVVDDLRSFQVLMVKKALSFLYTVFRSLALTVFPQMDLPSSLIESLNSVLFNEKVSQFLFQMYHDINEEEDKIIDEKLKKLKSYSYESRLELCGVNKDQWKRIIQQIDEENNLKTTVLIPDSDSSPYQRAVSSLKKVSSLQNVKAKLDNVVECSNAIEKILTSIIGSFGADDFLPIFCFVMIDASISGLDSECSFIDDFIDEDSRHNIYGYMLAQLQIAAGFFKRLSI